MKHFWVVLFFLISFFSQAQVVDTTFAVTREDSLLNDPIIASDSLTVNSNTDVLLSDCAIGDSCLPDIVVFENSGNTLVSTPNPSENSIEDYMNAGEVNPYKFNATTVPKGAVINLLDSGMPNYYTPCLCGVNSPFGYRRWGRYYQFHPGIDLNLGYGQPARAAFDGVVRFSKMTPGYGNCVIIRHPNGLETLYGHFSSLNVVPGQAVKAGDVVGFCGNTGYSFGAHLHFEIRYMGVPFDPSQVVYTQQDSLKKLTITIDNALFKSNTPPPPSKYKYVYHVIKKGESLSVIARKYRVSVAYLCKLNRISTKTILRPGRTLRIR
ncbi:MAG: M23 family metallopeptidase [Bacteroidetes bacterium]|nr:M23 family metallopeptidase [Bacteroidota bacterium]